MSLGSKISAYSPLEHSLPVTFSSYLSGDATRAGVGCEGLSRIFAHLPLGWGVGGGGPGRAGGAGSTAG